MPTQKTLREIIEKLSNRDWIQPIACKTAFGIMHGEEYNHNLRKQQMDSAISEIKSLLKEKLPKKKETPFGLSNPPRTIQEAEIITFNSCLTEIEQIIESL